MSNISFSLIEEVAKVHGQLVDLRIVVLLQFDNERGIGWRDEVDGDSSSTESSRSSDSVDVFLLLAWQVVVDDQVDLLNVDSSTEQIGTDQDS